jgi:dipeptidyl aminopeptidase
MMTPQMNPDGYEQSAINKMEGFDNIKFLLLHGTADDNGKMYIFELFMAY